MKSFLNVISKKFSIKTLIAEHKKGNIAAEIIVIKNGFKHVKTRKKGVVVLIKKRK